MNREVLPHIFAVFVLEHDLAANDFARWVGNQSHNGKGADAFSAAALSYQTQGLARFQILRDAVNGLNHSFKSVEVGL